MRMCVCVFVCVWYASVYVVLCVCAWVVCIADPRLDTYTVYSIVCVSVYVCVCVCVYVGVMCVCICACVCVCVCAWCASVYVVLYVCVRIYM
jgi:hypothetical protein